MKKTIIPILLVLLMFFMSACGSTAAQSDLSDDSSLRWDEALIESKTSMVEEPRESKNDFVSSQYEVGDIILDDGSLVKRADLSIIDNNNVPIAIIAGFQENGTAFGIGVHRSNEPLQWELDDGVNYPAFHFVNTYAKAYNLSDKYSSGWYMPSIDELCDIYINREEVNSSLQLIYGLDKKAAMNGLETNWYWSSSQADSKDDYVWFVHYFNGYAGECPKNFTNVHVLVVRAF